jgi:hypothetical protein
LPPITFLIYNHFNQDRHLNRRNIFKKNRSSVLAEWCQLAARDLSFPALWRLVCFRLTTPVEALNGAGTPDPSSDGAERGANLCFSDPHVIGAW